MFCQQLTMALNPPPIESSKSIVFHWKSNISGSLERGVHVLLAVDQSPHLMVWLLVESQIGYSQSQSQLG